MTEEIVADVKASQGKKAIELLKRQQAERINACNQAVMAALKKYNCRLGTLQRFIDGQPEPMQVIVLALE